MGDPRFEGSGVADPVDDESRRKEIYTYDADWTTNALSWSARTDKPFRLAVASYIEEYANRIDVIQLNEEKNVLERTCSFQHPYPSTKILFCPDSRTDRTDLLATTGDYVRLWEINSANEASMKSCLNNNRKSDFCAPLTSFDWNVEDARRLVTSSIDTTCSIWDLEKETATQLIAHDKEVFDVAFAKGTDIFGSVGADGSVRLFDMRNLEHSTILYETEALVPVLRISWNKQDANYLAVIQVDSPGITLLDVRVPSIPVATLNSHQAAVNGIQWAPHSSCHLCSAADDSQALIWDLSALPKPIEDPILAYPASAEINSLHWSSLHTAWISISFAKKVQILRV